MAKHDNNAVIVFLGVVVGILLIVIAFFLLRLLTVDKQLRHTQREVEKAVVMLRDEREKFRNEVKKERMNE